MLPLTFQTHLRHFSNSAHTGPRHSVHEIPPEVGTRRMSLTLIPVIRVDNGCGAFQRPVAIGLHAPTWGAFKKTHGVEAKRSGHRYRATTPSQNQASWRSRQRCADPHGRRKTIAVGRFARCAGRSFPALRASIRRHTDVSYASTTAYWSSLIAYLSARPGRPFESACRRSYCIASIESADVSDSASLALLHASGIGQVRPLPSSASHRRHCCGGRPEAAFDASDRPGVIASAVIATAISSHSSRTSEFDGPSHGGRRLDA